ncbi:hypothetical protein ACHAXH_003049, partial [Discostella pseudostelligera]
RKEFGGLAGYQRQVKLGIGIGGASHEQRSQWSREEHQRRVKLGIGIGGASHEQQCEWKVKGGKTSGNNHVANRTGIIGAQMDAWDRYFPTLVEFVSKNPHCIVPRTKDRETKRLYRYVSSIRLYYNRKMDGVSTMEEAWDIINNDPKLRRLAAIHFCFKPARHTAKNKECSCIHCSDGKKHRRE